MSTWKVTVYESPSTVNPDGSTRQEYRLTALSPKGDRVMHREHLSLAQVEAFDAPAEWAAGMARRRR